MRQGDAVTYLHTDHLGTVSVATSGNGQFIARTLNLPYGGVRWTDGTMPTDWGYTGQKEPIGTGLVYLHARFYAPATGRFISPDTMVPNRANPQDWNRYAYARNNPLVYTDPSGHQAFCFAGLAALAICGGIAVAAYILASYYAVMPPPPLPGIDLSIDLSAAGAAAMQVAAATNAVLMGALDDMGPDYPLPSEYIPGAVQATYPLAGTSTLFAKPVTVPPSLVHFGNVQHHGTSDPEDPRNKAAAAKALRIGAVTTIVLGLVYNAFKGITDENPQGPDASLLTRTSTPTMTPLPTVLKQLPTLTPTATRTRLPTPFRRTPTPTQPPRPSATPKHLPWWGKYDIE